MTNFFAIHAIEPPILRANAVIDVATLDMRPAIPLILRETFRSTRDAMSLAPMLIWMSLPAIGRPFAVYSVSLASESLDERHKPCRLIQESAGNRPVTFAAQRRHVGGVDKLTPDVLHRTLRYLHKPVVAMLAIRVHSFAYRTLDEGCSAVTDFAANSGTSPAQQP